MYPRHFIYFYKIYFKSLILNKILIIGFAIDWFLHVECSGVEWRHLVDKYSVASVHGPWQ